MLLLDDDDFLEDFSDVLSASNISRSFLKSLLCMREGALLWSLGSLWWSLEEGLWGKKMPWRGWH